MIDGTPFAYDAVEYPSLALPQVHPGHLHALARMFGCDPAPVERGRVLEVGCGDGLHLIACAVGLPEATFVGLDLSAVAVERGNRTIAELGLTNIALHAVDVTAWVPPPEPFDYAFAHGFYSWVPLHVRDALLKLFAEALAPTGIGYISYNTYPGCYVRRMVWEMMRLHTAEIDDPRSKIAEAREFVRFLAAGASKDKSDAGLAFLGRECEHVLEETDPRVLYHDDLGAINDPAYLRDFAAHAGRFGLRFVAEAEPNTMETRAFAPEIAAVLDGLAEADVLRKEQYLDFLRLRRFRQTLLSPDGGRPAIRPDPTRIATLAVSGRCVPEGGTVDPAAGADVAFRTGEALIRTDHPIGKAALMELGEIWPKRIPFPELAARAAVRLGRPPTADELTQLRDLLTTSWMVGLIQLHGHVPGYSDAVSARPVACPLARLQVRSGGAVSTRLHTTMHFEDAPSRRMLASLDGTRDLDGIAAELAGSFPPDARPDPAALRDGVAKNLLRLAKAGLLVG